MNNSSKKNTPSDSEDFEKTVLDIDLNDPALQSTHQKTKPTQSSQEDLEKTMFDFVLEESTNSEKKNLTETLIFKAPPLDEEHTNLHQLRRISEENSLFEETGQIDLSKEVDWQIPSSIEKLEKPLINHSAASKESTLPSEAVSKSISSSENKPFFIFFEKLFELTLGIILLATLIFMSVEAFSARHSTGGMLLGVTASCLVVSGLFIWRSKRLDRSLELSLIGLAVVVGYSLRNFGPFDPNGLKIFNQTLGGYLPFFFVFAGLVLMLCLFMQSVIPFWGRILGVLLIAYGLLSFAEGFSWPLIAHEAVLKQTFDAQSLGSWFPVIYLKPTFFLFWVVTPLLAAAFTYSSFQTLLKKQWEAFRWSSFGLTLASIYLLLGHLLFQKLGFASLWG